MKDVRPCPYCSGEVEVVKLNRKSGEKESKYRIQCMHCKMTVARGFKFEKESDAEGKERIKQYNKFIEKKMARISDSKLYAGSHKPSGKDLLISAGER